jgi:hypothetical protein
MAKCTKGGVAGGLDGRLSLHRRGIISANIAASGDDARLETYHLRCINRIMIVRHRR